MVRWRKWITLHSRWNSPHHQAAFPQGSNIRGCVQICTYILNLIICITQYFISINIYKVMRWIEEFWLRNSNKSGDHHSRFSDDRRGPSLSCSTETQHSWLHQEHTFQQTKRNSQFRYIFWSIWQKELNNIISFY